VSGTSKPNRLPEKFTATPSPRLATKGEKQDAAPSLLVWPPYALGRKYGAF